MILPLAILIFSALDAWRDAWINQAWWPRHLVKWAAFFGPIIFILWREGWLKFNGRRGQNLAMLTVVSFIIWKLVYTMLTN